MDNGIERVIRHAVFQQVLQPMTAQNATTVIHNGQSDIQIGIVAEHVLHNLIMELVVDEFRVIGLKVDICSILVLGGLCHVTDQFATLEDSLAHLAVAVAMHLETTAQRIDSLHTHTIQTDRLLESLRVELTTGIQDTDRLDEFSLWDTTTIVTDGDTEMILYRYLNAVARLHLKLVDRVVEDLLQQHIDSVFCGGTVTQATDIHTGTEPDMLQSG